MAELTQEQFESVPDFLQGDYEKVGDVYQHKSEIEFSSAKASFKQKMDDIGGKLNTANGELESFKSTQAQAIEDAKRQALEQARTKGEVTDVERIYEEKIQDLTSRMNEKLESERSQKETLLNQSKQSKREALLADARSKLKVFDESAKIFDKVVGSMIDVDPITGKETFLSEDGSATSLDRAGFYDQLEKDPAFARMRKAEVTSTGGMANGNNGAGGPTSTTNQAADTAKQNGDLNGYLSSHLSKVGA